MPGGSDKRAVRLHLKACAVHRPELKNYLHYHDIAAAPGRGSADECGRWSGEKGERKDSILETWPLALHAPTIFGSTLALGASAGLAAYGTDEWCKKMRTLPSSQRWYPNVYSTFDFSPVVAQVKT